MDKKDLVTIIVIIIGGVATMGAGIAWIVGMCEKYEYVFERVDVDVFEYVFVFHAHLIPGWILMALGAVAIQLMVAMVYYEFTGKKPRWLFPWK